MEDVATLLAKKFIQRRDVKAVQMPNGEYHPHTANGRWDGERLPWKMRDIHQHLSREVTYGHYLLDRESNCKLFAFDIDLVNAKEPGYLPFKVNTEDPNNIWWDDFRVCEPRVAWQDRRHPGRVFMKYQFRLMAEKLAAMANKEMGLPVAVAYSGWKGVHVYCFTGSIPASDARDGAQLVLDSLGEFILVEGNNKFKHQDSDPKDGFPNLTIEVFPKQRSLDGKDLGNLMRLPLGRNVKTTDPTFFVDLTRPPIELTPIAAEIALTTDNPWSTL